MKYKKLRNDFNCLILCDEVLKNKNDDKIKHVTGGKKLFFLLLLNTQGKVCLSGKLKEKYNRNIDTSKVLNLF